MNRCDVMRNELKAYLDGQMPFMLRQQVRRHLKRCVACREELSAMEQTGNQLKADAPTPLEASLRAKILAAADSLGPKPGDRPKAPSKWRRKPLMVWAVAATALTAWCVIYPLTHFTQSQTVFSKAQARVAEDHVASTQPLYGAPAVSAAPMATPTVTEPAPSAQMIGGAMPGASGQAADTPVASPRRKLMMEMMKKHTPLAQAPQRPGFNPDTIEVSSDYWKQNRMGSAGEAELRTKVANARAEMAGKAVAHQPSFQAPIDQAAPARAGSRGVSAATLGKVLQSYTQDADEVERTVHKEAQITVVVDNVEAKSEAVEQITQGVGGYVADNNLNTEDDGLKTASLTLKVPVAQFQSVLNQVARQGEVKAKSLSGQDLTEEISDQKQSEHALREDIQSTQQQLTQRLSRMGREERMDTLRELRTQVAQKQARLKLLHKLGALSTITVELDEKPHTAPAKPQTSGFMNEMNETLHGAVQSMMQAARLPILTFIWIIAYAPLWILLIFGYRWAVRR